MTVYIALMVIFLSNDIEVAFWSLPGLELLLATSNIRGDILASLCIIYIHFNHLGNCGKIGRGILGTQRQCCSIIMINNRLLVASLIVS